MNPHFRGLPKNLGRPNLEKKKAFVIYFRIMKEEEEFLDINQIFKVNSKSAFKNKLF